MQPITILLVDDHAIFRQACSEMLQRNKLFEVLACTHDAGDALRIISESAPDITLLDINMQVNGFELARQISATNTTTKIIGFSMHAEGDVAYRFMKSGASGYISKTCSMAELSDAIIRVHHGEAYFSKDKPNFPLKNSIINPGPD